MKTRRTAVAFLCVAVIAAASVMWFSREQPANLVLAARYVDTGTVAITIDHFELTRQLPGRLRKMPPAWMGRYPVLIKGWTSLFRDTLRVQDGLVWVLVDATVATDQPIEPHEIEYQLDYGTYTIGTDGGSIRKEAGRPYQIGTRFEVTDGPLPKALAIQVNGEWVRFPIEVR